MIYILLSPQNAPKDCVSWPGSAQTHWGSLHPSPRPPSWIKGLGEGKGKVKEEEAKGKDPQCVKCVDTPCQLIFVPGGMTHQGNVVFLAVVVMLTLHACTYY